MARARAMRDKLKKRRPPKKKLERAFHEVYANVPSTVRKAGVTGKRKQAMMTAIAFSKARKNK